MNHQPGFCATRAVGAREGMAQALWVGSQWFGGLVLSGSWVISTPCVQSSALGQHYTLSSGWSWPLCAGGGATCGARAKARGQKQHPEV